MNSKNCFMNFYTRPVFLEVPEVQALNYNLKLSDIEKIRLP